MSIATLIALVCVIGSANDCETRYFPSETIICSPAEAQHWISEHPGYELRRWGCRVGRDA